MDEDVHLQRKYQLNKTSLELRMWIFFGKIDLGLDEYIEELNSLNCTTAEEEVIWSHELPEKRLKEQIHV